MILEYIFLIYAIYKTLFVRTVKKFKVFLEDYWHLIITSPQGLDLFEYNSVDLVPPYWLVKLFHFKRSYFSYLQCTLMKLKPRHSTSPSNPSSLSYLSFTQLCTWNPNMPYNWVHPKCNSKFHQSILYIHKQTSFTDVSTYANTYKDK